MVNKVIQKSEQCKATDFDHTSTPLIWLPCSFPTRKETVFFFTSAYSRKAELVFYSMILK